MKPKYNHNGGSPTDGYDVAGYLAQDPVDRWRTMLRVEGSWARVYAWRAQARLTPEIIEALRLEGLTPHPDWQDLQFAAEQAATAFARTL